PGWAGPGGGPGAGRDPAPRGRRHPALLTGLSCRRMARPPIGRLSPPEAISTDGAGMTLRSNSAAARDVAHHLHPFTNAARHEADGPLVMSGGHGVHVRDSQGRDYIEGMSGLWCTSLGYNEPRLVRAATKQLETLPFYHNFSHM